MERFNAGWLSVWLLGCTGSSPPKEADADERVQLDTGDSGAGPAPTEELRPFDPALADALTAALEGEVATRGLVGLTLAVQLPDTELFTAALVLAGSPQASS